MSLALSTWSSRSARRPLSRILLRRPPPSSSRTTDSDSALLSGFLLMGFFLLLSLVRHDAELLSELLLGVRVLEEVRQHGFQLVVTVGLRQDVAKLLARFDELSEGLDLLDHLIGLEVRHIVELHLDVHLAAVVGQLVVDSKRQARRLRREHLIEVVAVDLDQLPIFQPRELFDGLAGEVAEDADDERQLLHLDGPADLHVIRDLDAGRANPLQFLLDTFLLRHGSLPQVPVLPDSPFRPRVSRRPARTLLSLITSTSQASSGICPHAMAR